jgi:hypothetical protein
MIWPFKKKHERCQHCLWIVGHTPDCPVYKNCNHEWARFTETYGFDVPLKVSVFICRKCLSIRIFDIKDARAKFMLKGKII